MIYALIMKTQHKNNDKTVRFQFNKTAPNRRDKDDIGSVIAYDGVTPQAIKERVIKLNKFYGAFLRFKDISRKIK